MIMIRQKTYFIGDYKSTQIVVCSNDGITDEKQIGKRLKKEDGAIHDAATGILC